MQRRFNWIREAPAHAWHYDLQMHGDLPSIVDLRPDMPPIVDQGKIGSCTGNAIAGALGYLEMKQLKSKTGSLVFPDGKYDPISRLFIYFNERAIEGTTHQDAGATLSDGIEAIDDKGVCRESTWPYMPENALKCPPSSAYGEAWHHKVLIGLRVNQELNAMRDCLAGGDPFVFGITIYESFILQTDGNITLPLWGYDDMRGGHALCCVGYHDAREVFIVRNSWGEVWGDKGYCYIPYSYLLDDQLAADFWTLRR